MANVLPPSYVESELQKELDKAIKEAKPLEGDELIFAIDSMADTAQENETALLREMKELSGYALEIDQDFRKISKLLSDIDTAGSSLGLGVVVSTFIGLWRGYHQEYVILLWESRKVAGKARSAVENFSADLLPYIADPTESIELKKKELENQKQKLQEDSASAQNMSQRFTDLSENIKNFSDEFRSKMPISNQEEEIKRLDKELCELKMTLEELNKQANLTFFNIGEDANKCLPDHGSHCCSGGFYQEGGCSRIVRAHLPRLLDSHSYGWHQDSYVGRFAGQVTEQSIKDTERKRAMAEADLMVMQAIHATLTEIEPTTAEIYKKLGAFASVWATIRADIQEIEEKIDYARNTTAEKMFMSKVKAIQKMYDLLGKALYQYERQVTLDNHIFMSIKN
ncbi:uncharacterized protein ARMOST_11652 [Armillaria ostoyae]|uniref:Uncharacterized protein n=1 Tax=Armillaria ostoyae TaxID=47428 RepID=A0A284RHQ4_ARMOS|nr:uncharacterized protein ARMOST_11652 [Armillaria ostoyae]